MRPTLLDRSKTPRATAILSLALLLAACRERDPAPSPDASTDGSADVVLDVPADFTVDQSDSSALVGEPAVNTTCNSARPLSDGQILRDQNLQDGLLNQPNTCASGHQKTLFYRVRLLPTQTAQFTITPRGNVAPEDFLVSMRPHCGVSPACVQFLSRRYTNQTATASDFILEVTHSPQAAPSTFDLVMTLSLPPGGIQVSPTEGLITDEGGGAGSFDVVLTTPVVQPVTVAIASDNPQEGIATPDTLTFTDDNWDKPQRVTVTGVDDNERDGDRAYAIKLLPATSADLRYAGVDGADVVVVNHDNEPGVRIKSPRMLYTTEAGLTASFSVSLHRAPSATVRIPITSSDDSEVVVTPSELVFEPSDWSAPRLMTVTGVDDLVLDGPQTFRVTVGPSTSSDVAHAGLGPAALSGRNADDEHQAVAPQAIEGADDCEPVSAPGMDQAGIVYVLLSCASNAIVPPEPGRDAGADALPVQSIETRLALSFDGGRTFGQPAVVGPWNATHVLGGRPAHAVIVTRNVDRYALVRSDDAGATWGSPRVLYNGTHPQHLAARGDVLAIGTNATAKAGRPSIWSSRDGGRTTTLLATPWLRLLGALHIDEQGVLWIAGLDEIDGYVVRSTRDGMTFDLATKIPNGSLEMALGSASAYSILDDRSLLVTPLRPGALSRTVPGLLPRDPVNRTWMVPTPGDGLIVFEPKPASGVFPAIAMRWLGPGALAFGAARELGQTQPTALPLSPSAALVVNRANGKVVVRVDVRE